MPNPTLIIQTVCFHESDRDLALRLGSELYETLTRPISSPLSFGPGIPVFSALAPEEVDMGAADRVVVIPVLGEGAFQTKRQEALDRWTEWRQADGLGLVLAVQASPRWRGVEAQMPGKPHLTPFFDEPKQWETLLDEIALALTRNLEGETRGRTLFVSYAADDMETAEHAVEQIREHTANHAPARAFFDRTELLSGERLESRLAETPPPGVFLIVRSDHYSSRAWLQRELFTAKRHALPALTVVLLKAGEMRSSPYGGNGPTRMWTGRPGPAVSAAMREYLRDAYFHLEADRVRRQVDLPRPVILSRPPELLDTAQGPVESGSTQLVFHPDPELSFFERQVLKAAHPRLHLATPTTAFRRLIGSSQPWPNVDAPMDGMQVAMSLSDSPDVDGPEGFTRHHVVDATVFLARTLISTGAAVAYGGDFRRNGFTRLLAELILSYNRTATRQADFLHSYLAAPIHPGSAPSELPLRIRHLAETKDPEERGIVPVADDVPRALNFSDMRRVMAERTAARIVMAGQSTPRLQQGSDGYGGRYPGVVEEAWWALKNDQPLYVAGGFGGAARLVAQLLSEPAIPDSLKDETWWSYGFFRGNAIAIDESPHRKRLGLPKRMQDLAADLRQLAQRHLASDAAAAAWNGLSLEDNQRLFVSRDPVTIASLVIKGLMRVTHGLAKGKLEIELVNGAITGAAGLDALAVAAFDDIELGGAGGAVDEAVGRAVSLARRDGTNLVPLDNAAIGASWIYLASLGPARDLKGLPKRIRAAAAKTAEVARRHGLHRLGVVAFGASAAPNPQSVVTAMAEGLRPLADFGGVTWFETDAKRHADIWETLKTLDNVRLTTRSADFEIKRSTAPKRKCHLSVRLKDDELSTTVLPPDGGALAGSRTVSLDQAGVERLSVGYGREDGSATPPFRVLEERGRELARLMLGDDWGKILEACGDAEFVLTHDLNASSLPFEALSGPGSDPPPAIHGFTRRLAVEGIAVERLFRRPTTSERLKVLLVIDPANNLPGAKQEGKAVESVLAKMERVDLQVLPQQGRPATKENFREALDGTDLLHYCGHAFYEGSGPDQSGLKLHGDQKLLLRHLKGTRMPRIALVNACQSSRVRGAFPEEVSFAEFFLLSGVEAYLGTYWRVGDSAAKVFALTVYSQLAEGKTLQQAVTQGRKALYDKREKAWANYQLYGDGRLKLT